MEQVSRTEWDTHHAYVCAKSFKSPLVYSESMKFSSNTLLWMALYPCATPPFPS